MGDLNSYVVIGAVDLPHCEEGEHEQFDRCPDCNPDKVEGARDGFVIANAKTGTYKLCPTCGGTRASNISLGMRECPFPLVRYVPGQTVKLSAKFAAPYIKEGVLAQSPDKPDELIVRHAAKQLGMVEA